MRFRDRDVATPANEFESKCNCLVTVNMQIAIGAEVICGDGSSAEGQPKWKFRRGTAGGLPHKNKAELDENASIDAHSEPYQELRLRELGVHIPYAAVATAIA